MEHTRISRILTLRIIFFKGIEKPFKVGHYHSWVVDEKTMSDSINCIAKSEDFVMGCLIINSI